jgi:hypothetical protein
MSCLLAESCHAGLDWGREVAYHLRAIVRLRAGAEQMRSLARSARTVRGRTNSSHSVVLCVPDLCFDMLFRKAIGELTSNRKANNFTSNTADNAVIR